MDEPDRYFIINKPVNMVSQFISSHTVPLLGNLGFNFPAGTHAIGRLDKHSEGLLLLTTNKKITRLLFNGPEKHTRVYLVQVNNILSEETLQRLRQGVSIRIKQNEDYITPPCSVTIVKDPAAFYPHYNNRETYGVDTWLTITLTEGKYHQVRKMTKAVHHRCKRLIRISIENMMLDNLPPGSVQEITEAFFFEKLRIRT